MYTQMLIHSLNSNKNNFFSAYPFDCAFFSPICLTARALLRIAMRSSLGNRSRRYSTSTILGVVVVATEPEKRPFKRAQLKVPGL